MPLHLPAFLVNPIPFQYVDDDWHVIAYFSGHPEFECVEAMFSARGDGTYSVRAILTRHDQVQVDYVNDPALLKGETGPERVRVLRAIEVTLDGQGGLPTAEVRFESLANGLVVLKVACASPPDPSRGGLTDPGAHALGTSLPMMWRHSSAVAGPDSSVHIAGVRYPIPETFRRGPHFVALRGFYTRGFHMAAIRNESRTLRVLRQPLSLAAGERWVYETPSGELAYEIQARIDDQTLRITSSARQGETVFARETRDGLALDRIELQSLHARGPAAAISFEDPDAFSIGVAGRADVVAGSYSVSGSGLVLQPHSPAWAVARPVGIRWTIKDDGVSLETVCREASGN
ncbi:hypothetical protein HHL11_07205 [Ramlibacter sp. G-1-2-2]|uniref:Uncharacterized protein n=1 Tax=Ramlibacter agri TaxID=2728837 RepID=A0A848H2Z7_9BURK|nr:hypothetical protein [Ramlibacter agri]NML43530.1 hypothetical protein [Ramlibacter agri]